MFIASGLSRCSSSRGLEKEALLSLFKSLNVLVTGHLMMSHFGSRKTGL